MFTTSHPTRLWIPLLAMIALALSALPPAITAKDNPKQRHCVVHLEPAKDGQPSAMREGACFASLAESVAAATDGRVQLPTAATSDEVDQALRNAATTNDASIMSFVLSIEYLHANFQGSTYTFTGTEACTPGYYYWMDTFNSSWNDHISSSRSYSNCNIVRHYEHSYRWGAILDCYYSCSGMGAMNDQTSSLEWYYY